MVPFYLYDEKVNKLFVDYFMFCDQKVLINTDLLVTLLEHEFNLSISASEFVYAVFWDEKYECIGILGLAKGTERSSSFRFSTVFRSGILLSASSFSLVHNHPNRTLVFSPDDIKVTENFNVLGKILKLPLYEHVLIANNKYITLQGGGNDAKDGR